MAFGSSLTAESTLTNQPELEIFASQDVRVLQFLCLFVDGREDSKAGADGSGDDDDDEDDDGDEGDKADSEISEADEDEGAGAGARCKDSLVMMMESRHRNVPGPARRWNAPFRDELVQTSSPPSGGAGRRY